MLLVACDTAPYPAYNWKSETGGERMVMVNSATRSRDIRARTLVLVAAALVVAVFLAIVVPTLQQVRASHVCGRLGGQLKQSTGSVEPLVASRTEYRCIGPGGTVVGTW
jgi:hypothetical protein